MTSPICERNGAPTLLARAEEAPDPAAIQLGHALERELALAILRTPESALAALQMLEGGRIALLEVAPDRVAPGDFRPLG